MKQIFRLLLFMMFLSKHNYCKLYTFISKLDKPLGGGQKVMLIDHGLYEYGYFNACFLENMMSLMVYALSHGYLPHIHLKDRGKGWTNWSSFFEQPFLTSSDVEYDCVCAINQGYFHPQFNTPYKKADLRLWCKVYDRLVRLNHVTLEYVNDEYHRLFLPHTRMLGVICRGTDYIKLKPQGHPVQPSVPQVIKRSEELMRVYNLDKIYLATEERAIHQQYEDAFPGRIIVNKRQYYDEIFNSSDMSYIYQVQFNRDNDIYLKGLEYLSSLLLLSKCDVLLGGNCGGACAALYMNNMKYEHVELFDLGLYP
jgi:hypothetical protein